MAPETPYKGLLINHDVGSGKTRAGLGISIKFATLAKPINTTVLLPAALIPTWKNELIALVGESNASYLLKYIDFKSYNGGGYDKLSKYIKKDSILIVDESHTFISYFMRIKNKKAKIYDLFFKPEFRPIKIIFMTATPIINSPLEMCASFNILKGDKQLFDVFDTVKFTNEYINIKTNDNKIDIESLKESKVDNIDELSDEELKSKFKDNLDLVMKDAIIKDTELFAEVNNNSYS